MGANAAWRVTGFVLRVSSWFLFGLFRERLENRVLEIALVSCRSALKKKKKKKKIMRGENMIS